MILNKNLELYIVFQGFLIYLINFDRNETETVAKKLCEKGIRAMAYHAGLSDEDRTFRHENWLKDRYKVNN